jgi:DNA repair protein RadC
MDKMTATEILDTYVGAGHTGLSGRLRGVLIAQHRLAGQSHMKIRDLAGMTRSQISQIPGVGKKSLAAIEKMLHQWGLALKNDTKEEIMSNELQLQRLYLRREVVAVPDLDPTYLYDRPEKVAALAQKLLADEVQEVCLAFFLNNRDVLLGYTELARGGFDWVTWDARTMMTAALLCGAKRIVMVHNHPSGDPKPSQRDVAGMKRLIPAADLLGLRVIDHIVVCPDKTVSMAEYGLLPPLLTLVREADRKREEDLDTQAMDEK